MKSLLPHLRSRLWRQVNSALVLVAFYGTFALGPRAWANPAGEQVIAGAAGFNKAGGTLTVTTGTDRTIINWQDFSIAAGETTRFVQPSALSATLNRVTGANISSIYGTLSSNGQIMLINPQGIFIGAGGVVNTAGFIASTLDVNNEAFKNWQTGLADTLTFSGNSTNAIQNLGTIQTVGGDVVILAQKIENQGTIKAPGSTAALLAGREVDLYLAEKNGLKGIVRVKGALSGDTAIHNSASGLIEAAAVQLHATGNIYGLAINNDGQIRATGSTVKDGVLYLNGQGGTILNSGQLTAKNAALTGVDGGKIQIEADQIGLAGTSVLDASGSRNGGTILVGGDLHGANPDVYNAQKVFVAQGAQILADGGVETGTGDGGKVVVWAGDWTKFYGNISARGGTLSGNGGQAEVSGKAYLDYQGLADLRSPGGTVGTLLLDPTDITISNGANNTTFTLGNNTFSSTASASILNNVTLGNQLNLSNVTVTTAGTGPGGGSLTVNNDIVWNGANTSLTFLANQQLTINANITNTGSGDFTATSGTMVGADLVQNAGSTININNGNVTLQNTPATLKSVQILGAIIVGAGNVTLSGTRNVLLSNTASINIGTGNLNVSTTQASGTGILINQNSGAGGPNITISNGSANFTSVAAFGWNNSTTTGSITIANGDLSISAATSVTTGNISVTNGNVLIQGGTNLSINRPIIDADPIATPNTLTIQQQAAGTAFNLLTGAGFGVTTAAQYANIDQGWAELKFGRTDSTAALNIGASINVTNANTATVALQSGTGGIGFTSGANVNLSGKNLLLNSGGTINGTNSRITANSLGIVGAGNFTLTNTSNSVGILATNATGTVTLTDGAALTMGNISYTSDPTLTGLAGSASYVITDTSGVTQAAVITANNFSLSVGNKAIDLSNAGNSFSGVVSLSNSGANNVVINDVAALNLGTVSVGNGTLSITSGGALTQTGNITQTAGAGDVMINAGANAITLTSANNDFTGNVFISNSGANNVALRDKNALLLGNISVGSGTLAITSNGTTSQATGSRIIQSAGAGSATFDSGSSGALTLSSTTNSFTGVLNLASNSNINARTTGNMTLGNVSVGGNLTLTATQGSILQGAGTDVNQTGSGNFTFTLRTRANGTLSIGGITNTTVNNNTYLVSNSNIYSNTTFAITGVGNGTMSGLSIGSKNALNLNNMLVNGVTPNGNISMSSTGNVVLVSNGAIVLSNITAGNLTVGAGNVVNSITQAANTSLNITGGANFTTLYAGNVSLTTPANVTLGSSIIGGSLNTFGGGTITNAAGGPVRIGGLLNGGTGLSQGGVTLTQGGDQVGSTGGGIFVTASGSNITVTATTSNSSLSFDLATALVNTTVAGNLTVVAGGLTSVGNSSTSTAITIGNSNNTNTFGNSVSFKTGIGTGGTGLVTNANVTLTQSSALTVNGTTSIGITGGTITLDKANNFNGAVSVTTTPVGDVLINNVKGSGLVLGTVALGSAGFTANSTTSIVQLAGTAINQTGAGAINFNAGGNVVLNNSGNTLLGPININQSTAGKTVALNSPSLNLGNINLLASQVSLAAGTITQSGAFSNTGGTVTFGSGTDTVTLTNTNNDLGTISGTTTAAVQLVSKNLTAANLTAGGALDLKSSSGSLTTSGTVQAAGALTATGSGITVNGALISGDSVVLDSETGSLNLNGNVQAPNGLTLKGAGVTESRAGQFTTNTLNVATTGDTLLTGNNTLTTLQDVTTGGGKFYLNNSVGDLTVTGHVTAGSGGALLETLNNVVLSLGSQVTAGLSGRVTLVSLNGTMLNQAGANPFGGSRYTVYATAQPDIGPLSDLTAGSVDASIFQPNISDPGTLPDALAPRNAIYLKSGVDTSGVINAALLNGLAGLYIDTNIGIPKVKLDIQSDNSGKFVITDVNKIVDVYESYLAGLDVGPKTEATAYATDSVMFTTASVNLNFPSPAFMLEAVSVTIQRQLEQIVTQDLTVLGSAHQELAKLEQNNQIIP